MHRVLTPADCRSTPWKNGGGRTTELAVRPVGATLARFDWRISVADVGADGPFSTFEGVDRTLVLLRGRGMRLVWPHAALDVRVPFEPVAFAGDVACECALVDGPVQDFNVMVRRDAGRGRVDVVHGAPGVAPPARFRLCYVARGACECMLPGRAALRLEARDALVVDADGVGPPVVLRVNPLAADAVALVVTVDAPLRAAA